LRRCHADLTPGQSIDVPDEITFQNLTDRSALLVLIDFWRLVRALQDGRARIGKVAADGAAVGSRPVNTEELPGVAQRFRISAIPTLMLFTGVKLRDNPAPCRRGHSTIDRTPRTESELISCPMNLNDDISVKPWRFRTGSDTVYTIEAAHIFRKCRGGNRPLLQAWPRFANRGSGMRGFYFNDEGIRTLKRIETLRHVCGANFLGSDAFAAHERVQRLQDELRFLRGQ
jgi:hypothetical protein